MRYLGALEGDGAELEREAVGEEDGLEGRARELVGVVSSGGSAARLLLGHGCGGGGGGGGWGRFRFGRSRRRRRRGSPSGAEGRRSGSYLGFGVWAFFSF
jgi:hypothetical protein